MNYTGRKNVCLGFSLEQKIIRLAILSSKDLESPWPLELRTFPDLDSLEEYWHDWLEYKYNVDCAGVGLYHYDGKDLGVLKWLWSLDIKAEEQRVPSFVYCRQIEEFKVPETFGSAYEQALCCLIRTHAKDFTELLNQNFTKLQNSVDELSSQLCCLGTALLRIDDSPPF